MTWINENGGLFSLVSLVLVLAIACVTIFILFKTNALTKNTIDSSLILKATYEIDSQTKEENVCMSVFNTNFRDIVLAKFGICYLDQTLDFITEYRLNEKAGNNKVAVGARSNINYSLALEDLESFVFLHNYDAKKIKKIYNVITDSVGTTKKTYNKSLTKLLKDRQKARLVILKKRFKAEKLALYADSHDGKAPLLTRFLSLFHSKKVAVTGKPDELTAEETAILTSGLLKKNEKKVKAPKVKSVVEEATAEEVVAEVTSHDSSVVEEVVSEIAEETVVAEAIEEEAEDKKETLKEKHESTKEVK